MILIVDASDFDEIGTQQTFKEQIPEDFDFSHRILIRSSGRFERYNPDTQEWEDIEALGVFPD